MNLAAWAECNGVARVTAYRWLRAGLLPVPARRVGRLILVDKATGQAGLGGRTAVYARVSSADQKADMTEILTSMCARLYGERAAQNRARSALAAAAATEERGAA